MEGGGQQFYNEAPSSQLKSLKELQNTKRAGRLKARVRHAAKTEQINDRLIGFIESGCHPHPRQHRPKVRYLWAFQAWLAGMSMLAARKDRWNQAAAFAGMGLAADLFGHGIYDPDFPIRIRLDSHAASRQVAAGNALALGLGGEGVGAGLGFFGGASTKEGKENMSVGAGLSTAARLSGGAKS